MKEDNKVIDSSRIEFLDYLKAICVLMVIITHYDWTDKTSPFFTICFIEIILLYLEDRTINLPRIFLLEGYGPGSYYVPVMLQLLAFFVHSIVDKNCLTSIHQERMVTVQPRAAHHAGRVLGRV